MDTISSVTETSKAWYVDLRVNTSTVKFKIDSGAAVSAIPESLSNSMGLVLRSTDRKLMGAGNTVLETLGIASVTFKYKGQEYLEDIYVIRGLNRSLLGKPTIKKLQLIKIVDEISTTDWKQKFPNLFQGLGTMKSQVKIELKEGLEPFAQATPRRVAAARRRPLQEELARMEKMGVIQRIEEPTEWCAPCIVVPKKNGKIRVCIDFTRLNKAVKRAYHPLPATDETIATLGKSKYFSKLDANCGYWQLRLDEQSQKLTTFITPFGRYFCKRLPFGISSAPEIFQREMQKALEGLEGVLCQMDDILIHTETVDEHTDKVQEVLERLVKAGITLNEEKCEFFQTRVTFLGHVIDQSGIHADPEKITAIKDFPIPVDRSALKRFLGMVNYLGKFSSTLADDTVNLRQLLKTKENDWDWNYKMDEDFDTVKQNMSVPPVLAPFSLDAETWLSMDASSYGLGAAVIQKTDEGLQPIALASRALSDTEQRYAQVEKEALATCWAAEKFYYFLAGREFHVETDHKPLVAIMGEKELSKLPLRVQRFRLRMMRFSYDVKYTPGEKLVVADALSRAPAGIKRHSDPGPLLIQEMIEELPISQHRRRILKEALQADAVASQLINYVQQGWPQYKEMPQYLRVFYTYRGELTVVDDILFYYNRIFIPYQERERVLSEIHQGHQGENRCLRRAREVVWWPGMSTDIREMVKRCDTCIRYRNVPREPMIPTPLPERPWWRIAMDFCTLEEKNGEEYLVVCDYYSRYMIAERFESATAQSLCKAVNKIICSLGVPNAIVSDNDPQFVSDQFSKLIKKWDIVHRTSAPRNAQSNGQAERGVQTFKKLASKNADIEAAVMSYNDSPLQNGYSPAQLLMGRSLNTMGYMVNNPVDVQKLRTYETEYRGKQSHHYNARHRVEERGSIPVGTQVILSDPGKKPCKAVVMAASGRELAVRTQTGTLLRRNRRFVKIDNRVADTCTSQETNKESEMLPIPLPPAPETPVQLTSIPQDSNATALIPDAGGNRSDVPASSSVNSAPKQSQRKTSRSSVVTAPSSSSCVTAPKQSQQKPGTTVKTNSEPPAQNISAGPVRSKSGRTIRPRERLNL